MTKILIVKMSALGDLIHAFPVLQYLKQTIPKCEIDWVVEQPFAELIRAHPLVHNVITVQTKKWRSHLLTAATWKEIQQFRRELRKNTYDIVLDLQGNMKSAMVVASAKCPKKVGFGYETVSEWPNVLATHQRFNPPPGKNVREEYSFLAQSACGQEETFKDVGVKLTLRPDETDKLNAIIKNFPQDGRVKVMICPGSNWPNKQLSEQTLREFLRNISVNLKAHFFLLWGNQAEKTIAESLSAALPGQTTILDKISLPTVQNLMSAMDLVIAMDSLPLHLAGTTSTASYSIFGPSSAQKYKPFGEQHEAYQGGCPYGQIFPRRCVKLRTCKTGACMKELKGEQLYSHFEKWWNHLSNKA